MLHALVKNRLNRIIILSTFLTHSIFVAYLGSAGFEGSWAGFFVFLLDFPISIFYLKESTLYFYFSSIVLGSAWWCFLILSILNIAKWVAYKFGKLKESTTDKPAS